MKMSSTQAESHSKAVGDELECKICCQRYDTQSRRPKVLPCRHRLCARCFSSILGMGGTPQCLRCPFCRHDTDITLCQVAGLPDDSNIIAQLANTEKCWPSDCGGGLAPQGLSSSLVEQDGPSQLCRHMPRILVWLLGFLYFGSFPLGIYMLVIQKVTLGIVCVSVVPCSLVVCLVYTFCQCLCHGTCT